MKEPIKYQNLIRRKNSDTDKNKKYELKAVTKNNK